MESVYSDCTSCRVLRLNVSGTLFLTRACTFSRIPDSVLGNPLQRLSFWDGDRKEYFLDRHRPSFEAIFQFYQTGYLKCPPDIPMPTFLEELAHYGFQSDVIEKFQESTGVIADHKLLPDTDREDADLCNRHRLWALLERPENSLLGRILGIASIIFVVVSIFSFCLETIPSFRILKCHENNPTNGSIPHSATATFTHPLFIVDGICTLWFVMEYGLRLLSSPSRLKFLIKLQNVIDLISILPYLVFVSMTFIGVDCAVASKSSVMVSLRTLRVFRVFKLARHYHGLRVLMMTLKASSRELGLFFLFIMVGSLMFGSALYQTEENEVSKKNSSWSIPQGMWWATVTMTSLGYGDITPTSPLGKCVGALCAMCGVLLIALPAPMIVTNFNKYYKGDTGRGFTTEFGLRKT